jgi:hypothetical protein
MRDEIEIVRDVLDVDLKRQPRTAIRSSEDVDAERDIGREMAGNDDVAESEAGRAESALHPARRVAPQHASDPLRRRRWPRFNTGHGSTPFNTATVQHGGHRAVFVWTLIGARVAGSGFVKVPANLPHTEATRSGRSSGRPGVLDPWPPEELDNS